eukprot:CAMPEP_0183345454 /NCGR_PEP_ID=MMETSP0164_2-20130417/10871_1 /TAXON_ID=221442 /ORGANISM="Coccolithus pelagicus ssp braarudi, Strain PLY182g" /LENGTH=257 /DNA_ID=CAMNT_0025516593 /DNA_START=30 /DNA_END=803 /DNA_ORIENTATION=-
MAHLDCALEDIIQDERSRRSLGRAPGGSRQRDAGGTGKQRGEVQAPSGTHYKRTAPKAGLEGKSENTMGETLKVSANTIPNKLAGAICNVARASRDADATMPAVLATGPASINQAIKGIAIAGKYLLDEEPPMQLVVQPLFEKDLRSGSNVTLQLSTAPLVDCKPSENDLSAKDRTDCFKLAGAIAGRLREGEEVALTTKGQVPVLVVVKAIALTQEYITTSTPGDIKFAVKFVDLEDPVINTPSTYLHFSVLQKEL